MNKLIVAIAFSLACFISNEAQVLSSGNSNHSIVKRFDGKVFTWGWNDFGQLGNGNNTSKNNPVSVDTSGVLSGKIITMVSSGAGHSVALSSDGIVFSWGANLFGTLGNGSNTNIDVPIAVYTGGVLSGKIITNLSAGSEHTIVISSDGSLFTWGRNTYGELGNGTSGSNAWKNVPVAVDMNGVLSGKTIIQVAGGHNHSIALASDGTLYTWGNNGFGQLGDGSNTNSSVPVAVNTSGVLSGKTIVQIAAGYYHSLALASDGTIYSWGRNDYGQLGNGNTGTNRNLPVAVLTSGVLNGKIITKITSGAFHSLALSSDGMVYTWGLNDFGQLGNSNTGTNSNLPVAVYTNGYLNGKTITQIGAGFDHSLALDSDGLLYSWGNNTYGELGIGNNTHRNIPVQVNQSIIGVLPVDEQLPAIFNFELSQNYPNPFNPSTKIRYTIPNVIASPNGTKQSVNVTLKIYDVLGNDIATLVNEEKSAGSYEVEFSTGSFGDAAEFTSGVYFYKLQAESFVETKKMLLLR